VAGAVKSAEEALSLLPELDEVHLVLVDISLPGKNGIALVADIKKEYPNLPCLILSGHQEQDYVRKSLESGASGYVSKQNAEAVIEAIKSILAGHLYLGKYVQNSA
jgi:DNA-binding NarL/FixJ family response regulator